MPGRDEKFRQLYRGLVDRGLDDEEFDFVSLNFVSTLACSRLSDSRDEAKKNGLRAAVLFRFVPTIREPGTGLSQHLLNNPFVLSPRPHASHLLKGC